MDLLELVPKEIGIKRLLLLAYRGSVAHNMYMPNTDPNSVDDIDLMGVFLGPENYYIGLNDIKTTVELMIEKDGVLYDCVFYELKHFVKLLLKGNPNVLSMLWLSPGHYLYKSPYIEVLLDNRDIFSSKKVFHSFGGYASDQLKKMESYNRKGYMGEKRKSLVKKYGYDTKNAAHLIRLLMMGIEFLAKGKLKVFRTDDADLLLDIKKGKWSLEDIKKVAEIMFKTLLMARNNSKLPDNPDREKAEEIVSEIIYSYLITEDFET
jgi:predicted nucleotidyltransferase